MRSIPQPLVGATALIVGCTCFAASPAGAEPTPSPSSPSPSPSVASPSAPAPFEYETSGGGVTLSGALERGADKTSIDGTLRSPATTVWVDVVKSTRSADGRILDVVQLSGGSTGGAEVYDYGPLTTSRPTAAGTYATYRIIVTSQDFEPLLVVNCGDSECAAGSTSPLTGG
ncbi:hypothetical protein [Salinactinospora qingdaonensis]|uniref:hypothetical protein n=1 Tax=Salinactinospora qingdaonensis TaxID=702744 RepID=UPI0031EC07E4